MGTNFYVRGYRYSDSPKFHIGKKSASGFYCWHCGMELDSSQGRDGAKVQCPLCGRRPKKEALAASASGRDAESYRKAPKKTGVTSCFSFTWAMKKDALIKAVESSVGKCPSCGADFTENEKVIEDGSGGLYTMGEFLIILQGCPLQFFDSIGSEFS